MDERILFWGLGSLLGLAGLGLLGWAMFHDRARGRKRCPKCWCDMGHAGEDDPLRCPECGHRAKKERQLLRTRRKCRWACVALLLIGPSLYLLALPKARRDGWMTFVPNTILISCITEKPESWAVKEIASRMIWHGRDVSRLLDTKEFEMWGWQWRWLASKSAEKSIAASGLSNSLEEFVWQDRIYDDVFSRIPSPYNRAALPSLRLSFQVNDGLVQGIAAKHMAHICHDESNHDLVDSVRKLLMDRVESGNIDDTSYELVSSLMTMTIVNGRVVDWMITLIERPSDDLLRELAVKRFRYKDLEWVSSVVQPLLHSIADVQKDHPICITTLEAIYNIDPDNTEAESILRSILSDDSINDEQRDEAALLWGDTEKDEGPLFEYWRKLIDSRPDRHADIGMSILLYGLYDEHESAAPLMRELAVSTENLKVVYKMMSTLDEMGLLTLESFPQLKRLAASDNSRWQAFAEKNMRLFSDR